MWSKPTVSRVVAKSRRFCAGRVGRGCAVEQLEDRSLLSIGGIDGLGVLGDSLSDEYAGEWYFYARNWVELLAEERGVPLGQTQDWGEPRREGYEYNWARSGATTSSTLLSSKGKNCTGDALPALPLGCAPNIGANTFCNALGVAPSRYTTCSNASESSSWSSWAIMA